MARGRRTIRQFGRALGRLAAAAALVAGLPGCAPKPAKVSPADLQQARQAGLMLNQRFGADIMARLERGEDPIAIYVAYRDHAQEMTHDVTEKSGVFIRRVNDRVRDRSNIADDWESQQLAKFQFMIDGGIDAATLETAEIVTENKVKYFRWMKPIVMTEECLVCHGENIDPKILKLLKQDYADDEATGYFVDDLAGAYSVIKKLN